ncbi:MAG TPA: hypothetical protein VM324_04520 [Egibacteraceae bacterium]|nr:hypothetical protein [Egibacteraceae bacterium]
MAARRRAPRLGPEDRIAPHIARTGRFRKVDPLSPRELPPFSRLLAGIGWAILVEESLRRAYRSVRSARNPRVARTGPPRPPTLPPLG